MLSLDTEDDSKSNVTIISFFDGSKHSTFTGPECRLDAWDFLNKHHQGETCWACNMEYDIINLYGFEWIPKLVTLQYVSAGIMRAIGVHSKVKFYDTIRHWAYSVEEMGKYIGLPKLPQKFDDPKYCQRDAEIVWRFVHTMLDRYDMLNLKVRATAPGMAIQLFKKFYQYDYDVLPESAIKLFRKAYYGGRTEVYRLGKIEGKINVYDVNSLYPSVMRGFDFPHLGSWKIVIGEPDLSKEGVLEGWVYVPETDFPCLPVREKGEIIFPWGFVFGAWTYPELRQLIADGGIINAVKTAIEFRDKEQPFNDYVNFCYEWRKKAKTGLDSIFWKLFLNSLYGKFAQSRGITTIYYNKRKHKVEEKELESESKTSNVIWSAYVTSYARLRLLSFLRSCSEVYYTDTDSLFTPDEIETSSELGAMKFEGQKKVAEFIGNKLYVVDGEARAKGVPRKQIVERNLIFPAQEYIRTGRAIYRKPVRFREALAQDLQANYWYNVEKRIKKRYTKRRILRNGLTEPWNYEQYKRFVRDKETRKKKRNRPQ